MEKDRILETALCARDHAYAWFRTALGEQPTVESMHQLSGDVSLEAFALFEADGNVAFTEALASVHEQMTFFQERSSVALEELSRDYTKLFIGPDTLPLNHWESVFRKNDPVLFQQSTLDVRKVYLSEEVLPSEYPRVADDHVAIELDFMAYLAGGIVGSVREGNTEEALRMLKKSRSFLDDHLLKWIPKYAQGASLLIGSYRFYPESIMLLNEFLLSDSVAIDDIGRVLDSQWTSQRRRQKS